jgi:hypothetical protein
MNNININLIDSSAKEITSTCTGCGLTIKGDRYRCMKCYYAACDEAYYFG